MKLIKEPKELAIARIVNTKMANFKSVNIFNDFLTFNNFIGFFL